MHMYTIHAEDKMQMYTIHAEDCSIFWVQSLDLIKERIIIAKIQVVPFKEHVEKKMYRRNRFRLSQLEKSLWVT